MVFTPFKRAWLSYVQQYGFEYLGKVAAKTLNNSLDSETHKQTSSAGNHCANMQEGLSAKWPLASDFEQQALPIFLEDKISNYGDMRDIPSIKGTSGISPYLAAGVISPRYVLRVLITRLHQSQTIVIH